MSPLSDGTVRQFDDGQVEAWRRMTPAEKADVVGALCRADREKALASIRERFPDASAREQFLRLAIVTLGAELARQAYPEIDRLGLR